MTTHYSEIAFTPAVKAQQELNGSRKGYTAREAAMPAAPDLLGPEETAFIATQDSFYMASTSETGWPYIQHRGGPAGFIRVLSDHQLGFADFRGNRQYISLGNLSADNRVALFFMDYAHKARLKLLGRASTVDLKNDSELAGRLWLPGYRAAVERAIVIDVEAFDWNCPQHITPRYSEAQVMEAVAALRGRVAELEAELAAKS